MHNGSTDFSHFGQVHSDKINNEMSQTSPSQPIILLKSQWPL